MFFNANKCNNFKQITKRKPGLTGFFFAYRLLPVDFFWSDLLFPDDLVTFFEEFLLLELLDLTLLFFVFVGAR